MAEPLGKYFGKEEILAYIDELGIEIAELGGDCPELSAKIGDLQDTLDWVHWRENPEFIREDWFYGGFAETLAGDFGPTTGWPYDCIDWDKAAAALRQDYTAVEILGETYYVRS